MAATFVIARDGSCPRVLVEVLGPAITGGHDELILVREPTMNIVGYTRRYAMTPLTPLANALIAGSEGR